MAVRMPGMVGAGHPSLAGRGRILFSHRAPLEADVTPLIEGEVLSFSFQDLRFFQGTLNLRAVLVEGDCAEWPVSWTDGRWFGSWSARSVQGPPSTEPRR